MEAFTHTDQNHYLADINDKIHPDFKDTKMRGNVHLRIDDNTFRSWEQK